MDLMVGENNITRYKRLEELVLAHLSDSFYIYEIIRDMDDCRANYTDNEIISCLNGLVERGILRRHFAKYERVT